jgi:hypothetical protein
MLRDIRDLVDDHEACADDLRPRWSGLLSYRYIGRWYGSVDPRAAAVPVAGAGAR